ncbi:hypothetical protein [Psychromonas sp. KJ10-2]|uniref:hypothetical protein n=1 Tax=Psychromonas sp. KJ10-2 TaxID=3391822 RepID=UPI0039B3EB88
MNKSLNKVLLIVLIIMGVFYYFQQGSNTQQACITEQGFWNESQKVCEKSSKKIIFESLANAHPTSIIYPENERPVLLDTLEKVQGNDFLHGQFDVLVAPAQAETGPVYDRGTAYLNMSKMALLSDNRSGLTYFSAPFIINTMGSGVFTYVGLFSYDFNTEQARHLSSELLGNRVREAKIVIEEKSVVKDKVFVQEGFIKVHFKTHGPDQAASEYPTQDNHIDLQLVALDPSNDENATFRKIAE